LAGAQAMRGPENVRQDIPPDTIRRKTVRNNVEFHIIGRLGRIDAAKNLTHIPVATDYDRSECETGKSHPNWHQMRREGIKVVRGTVERLSPPAPSALLSPSLSPRDGASQQGIRLCLIVAA
jgi:hypothetical protein